MTTNSDRSLAGGIDIRCRRGPDSLPCKINAIELAQLAKPRGMRGIVLKDHDDGPTTSLAAFSLSIWVSP
jgi:hypothetical protein